MSVARFQRPDSRTKKVDPNRRSSRQTAQYSHYYAGGNYGSVSFPAGYYADPFWTWTFLGLAVGDDASWSSDVEDTGAEYVGQGYGYEQTEQGGGYEAPEVYDGGYQQQTPDSGYSSQPAYQEPAQPAQQEYSRPEPVDTSYSQPDYSNYDYS